MLTVHYSNQLETLADSLAQITREPLPSALMPEIVVVQSEGVARWLALRLAMSQGVCANVRFLLAGSFVWELGRTVLDAVPDALPFERNVLVWRVLRLLTALERRPDFASVAGYTEGDSFKRYQLARRIAETLDRYVDYRPDWLKRWEAGDDEHWLAVLWRALATEAPQLHRAALVDALEARIHARKLPEGLPPRLAFFGIPAIPPSQLALYAALGRHVDIHLLLPNPCREYWGDIASPATIARRAVQGRDAYLASGNALLASLGRRGRDVIDLLQDFNADQQDRFVDPGDADLLHAVQSDILNLSDRAGAQAAALAADDRSLQIHSCHGAMREVEVLHDQLLALFEQHPDLAPSDVVVMTPDIQSYAPHIEAVFMTAEPRIPFTVSDRAAQQESPLVASFLALLDLAGSRYEADAVLALLDEPAIRRRFALEEADLATVHRWVRESNVRWGIDARDRERLGLPATCEHTWRFGLDRLLLGHALPGAGIRLFADLLPYDHVEGLEAELLGRFQTFCEATFVLREQLDGTRQQRDWLRLTSALLDRFFLADADSEGELAAIRSAIADLDAHATSARFVDPMPFAVVRHALQDSLATPGRGFLTGGVTFCAMVPMRSLPFAVVCLIGMNDGAFPRQMRPYGFDLMAQEPRRGDPSLRDDDRYLFLDSLLCARRCLYLSYCGQDPRDNSEQPPSTVINELLDYIRAEFRARDGQDAAQWLVRRHPLQPFSRRYFDGSSDLFSYSQIYRDPASQPRAGAPAFVSGALLAPHPALQALELDDLLRFFTHPAKYFLRERLRLTLIESDGEIETSEPFMLDALSQYRLKQTLFALPGEETTRAVALARGAGELPHGIIGDALLENEQRTVHAFRERVDGVRVGLSLPPLAVQIALDGFSLSGALSDLGPHGQVKYRLGKLRARDWLVAWIQHLVLNAVRPEGVTPVTRWLAEDATLVLASVADAATRLAELAGLYRDGINAPLRFFPETSLACAREGAITSRVLRCWEGDERRPGERDDPYVRLAFRSNDPLDAEFVRLAALVCNPLLLGAEEEEP